jgi:hypothetical protein
MTQPHLDWCPPRAVVSTLYGYRQRNPFDAPDAANANSEPAEHPTWTTRANQALQRTSRL